MARKKRYILVEAAAPIERSGQLQFERGLFRELYKAIGEPNQYKLKPKIVSFLGAHIFVLRCDLAGYNDARRVLNGIKSLDGKKADFRTLKSSGTLRALSKSLPKPE